MRTVIYTNFDLCTGCAICQMACAEQKTGGTNPRLALLKVEAKANGLVHRPVVCNQCQNAFCMKVCPTEAIYRNDHNGAVLIDEEKCNGCGLCVTACQIDVIEINKETKKAQKCDLCSGNPTCVKYCPTGALEIIELGRGKNG